MAEVEHLLVEDFFLRKQQAIIDAQSEKGLKASGISASLLTVTQSGNITQLIDRAGYFEYQEFGRKPGKAPSWQKIYDWLAFKKYGLDWNKVPHVSDGAALRGVTAISPEENRERMAWALLMKIKRKGTYLHITKNPSGVLTDSINTNDLDELKSSLAKARSTQILTDVQRIFK